MIKDNLQYLRKVNNLTQEKMSELINVSRQAYGRWESGETIPDLEKCCKIADLFNVSLDSLVKDQYFNEIKSPPRPRGKSIIGKISIGENGTVKLPKKAIDLFELNDDCPMVLLADENIGLGLIREDTFMRNMQNILDILDVNVKLMEENET